MCQNVFCWTVAKEVFSVKTNPCSNAGDVDLIPGLGQFPGEGNDSPLQCSCLENPMDRGAWWAVVHGVSKSQTRLSDFTFTFHFHALEKEMAPTPVFLPVESQGLGSLVGAVYGVTQSRARLK